MLSFSRVLTTDNKFIAAILMDLSKAFDWLSHNLLMLKLEAYGLSENSLELLKSCLENRRKTIILFKKVGYLGSF
jgi:hypothetical protein